MSASDDFVGPMERLGKDVSRQLMKAVATLSESNATKRVVKGSAAGDK